jgi:hypothetical protein
MGNLMGNTWEQREQIGFTGASYTNGVKPPVGLPDGLFRQV